MFRRVAVVFNSMLVRIVLIYWYLVFEPPRKHALKYNVAFFSDPDPGLQVIVTINVAEIDPDPDLDHHQGKGSGLVEKKGVT